MAMIEEHLEIYGRRETNGGKMGHGFMPTITIHITWRLIVDYPINGYVVMEILSIVGALMHHHRGYETLSISMGEDERCEPEWFSLTSLVPPHPFNRE